MSVINEVMQTVWTKKWAESFGLDIKYADEALKMIEELNRETDYDEDMIEAVVLSSYPLNPPEGVFEKLIRSSKKGKGKVVKINMYNHNLPPPEFDKE